jgi:hypothetical protein
MRTKRFKVPTIKPLKEQFFLKGLFILMTFLSLILESGGI